PSRPSRRALSAFRVSVSSPLLGGYDEPETLRYEIKSDVPKVLTGDKRTASRDGDREQRRSYRPVAKGTTYRITLAIHLIFLQDTGSPA
ncbi:hypothetical protein AB9K34_19105, partial [Sedimentitalea sp. XS_ASV28]|uniref:hypothetical protein n=1 Tax=Sedimentitalea sp. XS_ASV28 TaxID=3241296 RepID=UPI003517F0A2